jgi:4-hydroxy-3-polyprenylbenzoate decarboxylase
MPFQDQREFIKKLEDENELIHVKEEVDWNLELGALTKKIFDKKGPALLFEKIRGYNKEFKIISGLFGPSNPIAARFAVAMEMPKLSSAKEIMEEFANRQRKPIKPKIISRAPLQENKQFQEEINLLKFPIPLIHQGDGGRYLAWHINVTKDPDIGWINWGTYRMMVYDKSTTAISFGPNRHIKSHFDKYKERKENMPMATVIGVEPICSIAAGTSIGFGKDEVDLAGALRKRAVEVVNCETIDLQVPASAEIVLEGEVSTTEIRKEGPFGEYHGYLGETTEAPVYHINCITHREDPVLPTSNMSTPIHDSSVLSAISSPASVLVLLKGLGYPVRAISTLFLPNIYVISLKKTHTFSAHHLAYALWGASRGRVCTHLIVVGEDIDVDDPYQVLWAFCTRVDPKRDIFIAPHIAFPQLTPFPQDEIQKGIGHFALYDADFPYYWPKKWRKKSLSFNKGYPEDIQNKVLDKIQRLLKINKEN